MTPRKPRLALAVTFAIACAAAVVGCASRPGADDESTDEFADRSGAQLWQENCARCHNPRSPAAYTDDQWQVALHHMRLRANLSGYEQRRITAFLKAGN